MANYVKMTVKIWQDDKGHIKMSCDEPTKDFITSINDQPNSKRSHLHAFDHFKRILKDHGKWKGE
ncbi:hypothetical protein J2Y03_005253 [Neobacillus niacini]|uniref:hypothetical protein n=1 Tax=Neobacillus niacini TaxID=86668 RepID=UPI00285CC8D2|nr:hypothetical protein [Neobacillus niacini]MDR7080193.1 hypothetical protein [Neobacillus niacini]